MSRVSTEIRAFDALGPLAPGVSVVEASAGTGKTWSIASLFVRLVAEQGIPVERVLVLTFARAAAAELRDRVRHRLCAARDAFGAARNGTDRELDPVLRSLAGSGSEGSAEFSAHESSVREKRVLRALSDLDAGGIGTVHELCHRIGRKHSFLLGADPGSELATDEGELLREIVDDFLTASFAGLSARDAAGACEDGGLRRGPLLSLAHAIVARPDACVRPAEAPSETLAAFTIELRRLGEGWEKRERERFRAEIFAAQDVGTFGNGKSFGRTQQGKDYGPLAKALGRVDAALNHEPTAAARLVASSGLSAADFAAKSSTGTVPEGAAIAQMTSFVELAARVALDGTRASFVRYLRAELPRRRRERREISFNDVLVHLRDGLAHPVRGEALRAALRGAYDVALMDELQDTDKVQWDIFRETFHGIEGKQLYLVGDPKQAIYGFRGADVRVYEDARDRTPEPRRSTLGKNHRSDGALVHALNALYEDRGAVFEEEGLCYVRVGHAEDRAPWRALGGPPGAASKRGAPAPLRFRWFDAHTFDSVDPSFVIGKTAAVAMLPNLVAHDVDALLASGATLRGLQGEARPIVAGDVAVLVRTNTQAAAVRRALESRGMAAITPQAGSVFATEEAEWLELWLSALVRENETATRSFALSPLGGLSAGTLHRALHDEGGEEGTGALWTHLREGLAGQRELFAGRGFSPAFHALLEGAPFAATGSVEPPLLRLARVAGGERAITSLRHLAELLHLEQIRGALGPGSLLEHLRRRRENAELVADEAELRLESDRAAIRVLTVHRSKGLEYPIVFLPFAWEGPSARGDRDVTVFHARDEAGSPTLDLVIDARLGKHRPDAARYEQWQAEEILAESLRLLYVGLTRAKHHAVVYTGPVSSKAQRTLDTSPLAILLHGGRDAAAPARSRAVAAATETTRLLETGQRASFRAVVDELAERAAKTASASDGLPMIEWFDEPAGAAGTMFRRTDPQDLPALRLAAAPLPVRSSSFARASYSSLTRNAHGAAPAPARAAAAAEEPEQTKDDDERATSEAPSPPVVDSASWRALPDVPLARFARGPAAGIFVHGLLERIDFRTGRERAAPGADLASFCLSLARIAGLPEEDAHCLTAALPALLRAPLGGAAGGIALADLSPENRLDELSFDLAVAGGSRFRRGDPQVSGRALARAFVGPGEEPPWPASYTEALAAGTLAFPDLAGFLTGSIDLVYRVGSGDNARYFIADYKTSWLGEPWLDEGPPRSTVAHYGRAALTAEMVKHHYFIQARFYVLALHRYLRRRLGSRYAYERHIGGAAYLFLRGMGPGVEGTVPPGVFVDRPPREAIEALDALLEGASR